MESNHPPRKRNNVSDVIMRRHVFSRETPAYGSIRFPQYLRRVSHLESSILFGMTTKITRGYTLRLVDRIMWDRFDRLARRLGHSVSGALAEAAREWEEKHRIDPTPDTIVKPNPRALNAPDPFAQHRK